MKNSIFVLFAFAIVLSLQLRAVPLQQIPNPPKLVIVSDIDDTIRFTRIHLRAHLFDFISGLIKQRAFTGMPALYQFLASQGAQIEYVSGNPKSLSYFAKKFLELAGFPTGQLYDREISSEHLVDFKYRKISELMHTQPAAQFILIGDNGEHDIEAYRRIQMHPQLGSRVLAVYIHKLYSGPVAKKLLKDQIPYYTAADLTAQLNLIGLTTDGVLNQVAKMQVSGMNSQFREAKIRAIPGPLSVDSQDLQRLKRLRLAVENPGNRDLLQSIEESLAVRSSIMCSDFFAL